MDLKEELKSAGTYPTGPCSAWPQQRNIDLMKAAKVPMKAVEENIERSKKVTATPMRMAEGLARTAGQALFKGKVTKEIRDERYETCKACPFFVEDSKRCSECGCFMEMKTWVGGNPDALCPKQKWKR